MDAILMWLVLLMFLSFPLLLILARIKWSLLQRRYPYPLTKEEFRAEQEKKRQEFIKRHL